MKTSLGAASVFVAHVAFLVGAYGSHFFGLALPYVAVLVIWLGVSSVIAAFAYGAVFARSKVFGGVSRPAVLAIAATSLSVSAGLFLAFNAYGT